ncbi:MAG: zinc-binding dehydrogenase [Nitrospinota bacterium]
MKAALFHEHGGPEKLRYEDFPTPEPGAGEVVVRVKACALNHLDLWVLGGIPGLPPSLPHILGSDIAGDVAEVGHGVKGIAAGDRVVVDSSYSCGACEFCLRGETNLCVEYKIVGAGLHGGFAEFCKVPARNIHPIPRGMSYEEIAATPLVFQTAWHMLVARVGLRAGEDVLIQAAGSGTGTAAIQIAKLLGARVFATAGSDEKCAKAKELGADEAINYKKKDFSEEVKRLTGGRGVDVVFDTVGADTWEKCLKSLARQGRLVTCGCTSGPTVQNDIRYLYMKHISIVGSTMGTKGEFLTLLSLFGQGKLKPTIDRTFPLPEARAALEVMKGRGFFGKLVLTV